MKELLEILSSEIQKNNGEDYPQSKEMEDKLNVIGYGIKYLCTQGEEDRHIWYSTREYIFEVIKNEMKVGFIKSRMIDNVFSEESSIEDIGFKPVFKECKPKEIIKIVYE
jgi:hypothetical protein